MNKSGIWQQLMEMTRTTGESGNLLRRIFAFYAGFAVILLVLAGAAASWKSYEAVSPLAAMKRMTDSVTAPFLIDMIGMESHALRRSEPSAFEAGKVSHYLAGLLLGVDPREPGTLLASEVPGMRGVFGTPNALASAGGTTGSGPTSTEPDTQQPSAAAPSEGEQSPSAPGDSLPGAPTEAEGTQPDSSGDGALPATTGGRKVVFVYHSHPRESWVPELNVKRANEAEDSKTNITMVGSRLRDKLEELGIGSVHSGADYPTSVQGYNWNYSYKYSLQTVKEALAQHQDITFLFDLHRDSAPREITTASIGGQDYARVYFIVGKKNTRWEQNEAFARSIHEKLEENYPGMSRGIWDKGSGGHAEYNQSVSPNSILVEVGGPFNTLEESYRTADALAKTIAELYWQAEKVNASVSGG